MTTDLMTAVLVELAGAIFGVLIVSASGWEFSKSGVKPNILSTAHIFKKTNYHK